ncbi:ImpA family metalloprotease [Psychromonas aquimarina]|uniref:ImpA family metalloprotease n=1 Tax=Psychromonas aquimarina TaxID=444919 RepID=UPI000404796C|nr:ImpA family metalloprotease [Psychromonas aquimarina]
MNKFKRSLLALSIAGSMPVAAYNAPASPTVYGAEDAVLTGAVLKNNRQGSGYTGGAYIKTETRKGDVITWTLDVPKQGDYQLSFRYASKNDRHMQLSANDSEASTYQFPATNNWRTWKQSEAVTFTLEQGENTINLETLRSLGPYIDNLQVTFVPTPSDELLAQAEGLYQDISIELDKLGSAHVNKVIPKIFPDPVNYNPGRYSTFVYLDQAASLWNAPALPIISGDKTKRAHAAVYTGGENKVAVFAGDVFKYLAAPNFNSLINWIVEDDQGQTADTLSVAVLGGYNGSQIKNWAAERDITSSQQALTEIDPQQYIDLVVVKSSADAASLQMLQERLTRFPTTNVLLYHTQRESGSAHLKEFLAQFGMSFNGRANYYDQDQVVELSAEEQINRALNDPLYVELAAVETALTNMAAKTDSFELTDGNDANFAELYGTGIASIAANQKAVEYPDSPAKLQMLFTELAQVKADLAPQPLALERVDKQAFINRYFAKNVLALDSTIFEKVSLFSLASGFSDMAEKALLDRDVKNFTDSDLIYDDLNKAFSLLPNAQAAQTIEYIFPETVNFNPGKNARFMEPLAVESAWGPNSFPLIVGEKNSVFASANAAPGKRSAAFGYEPLNRLDKDTVSQLMSWLMNTSLTQLKWEEVTVLIAGNNGGTKNHLNAWADQQNIPLNAVSWQEWQEGTEPDLIIMQTSQNETWADLVSRQHQLFPDVPLMFTHYGSWNWKLSEQAKQIVSDFGYRSSGHNYYREDKSVWENSTQMLKLALNKLSDDELDSVQEMFANLQHDSFNFTLSEGQSPAYQAEFVEPMVYLNASIAQLNELAVDSFAADGFDAISLIHLLRDSYALQLDDSIAIDVQHQQSFLQSQLLDSISSDVQTAQSAQVEAKNITYITEDDGSGVGDFSYIKPRPDSDVMQLALSTGDISAVDDIDELHAQISSSIDNSMRLEQAQEAADFIFDGELLDVPASATANFIEPNVWGSAVPAFPLVIGDKNQILAAASIANDRRSYTAAAGLEWLSDESFYRLIKWLTSKNDTQLSWIPLSVMSVGKNSADLSGSAGEAPLQIKEVPFNKFTQPELLVIGGKGLYEHEVEDILEMIHTYPEMPVIFTNNSQYKGSDVLVNQLLTELGYVYGASNKKIGDTANAYNPDDLSDLALQSPLYSSLIKFKELNSSLQNESYDFVLAEGKTPEFLEQFDSLVKTLRNKLTASDVKNVPLFQDKNSSDMLKSMVLLGDVYRTQIVYRLSSSASDQTPWLRAWFADHTVYYNRDLAPAQNDLGNFAEPVDSAYLQETYQSVLQPRAGVNWHPTGAYAHPGVPFTVELGSDAEQSVKVFMNTMRTGSTKEWGTKYQRPKYLRSPAFTVNPGEKLTLTSPYGGPVQINGALQEEVELNFTNVGQHLIGTMDNINTFRADLAATPYSWVYYDVPGFQLYSQRQHMVRTVEDYYKGDVQKMVDRILDTTVGSVDMLGGFVGNGNIQHSPAVLKICEEKGLNCLNESWHKRSITQRANHDFASHCGSGCSGNPYDSAGYFRADGWLEGHEIGHNLQIGPLKIYGGMSTEVSNNIFPMHMRKFNNSNSTKTAKQMPKIFAWMQEGQNSEDPTAHVKSLLWTMGDIDQLTLYMQIVYAAEYLGLTDNGFDAFTLLYLHSREVSKTPDWLANKDRLGMSLYESRPRLGGNDFMVISLSFLTGKDWREQFSAWGIEVSETAAAQVETYNLESLGKHFYVPRDTMPFQPFERTIPLDGKTPWQ